MLLRPASSTLFPYTTLFRSVHGAWLRGGDAGVHESGAGPAKPAGHRHAQRHLFAGGDALRVVDRDDAAGASPDRKSTRLNSSHMSISYAVFCLKKKTKA